MNKRNINPFIYFLIVFFLGPLGIHKFIDKKIIVGIIYLLTIGGFGIFWLIDVIRYAIWLLKYIKENNLENTTVKDAINVKYYNNEQNSNISKNITNAEASNTIFGKRDECGLTEKIDRFVLTYKYFIPLSNVRNDVLSKMKESHDYNLTVNSDGQVLFNGQILGSMPNDNRLKMCFDWERKKLPYIIELNNACLELNTATIRLGFYRDNDEYYSHCNKLTCKLISCTSEEKQMEIDLLETGYLLDYEEEFNDNTGEYDYNVFYIDVIGKLPKKAVEIENEYGIKAITVAELVENSSFKTIPVINIYYYGES